VNGRGRLAAAAAVAVFAAGSIASASAAGSIASASAAAAAQPVTLISAANPAYGMTDTAGTWTDGTTPATLTPGGAGYQEITGPGGCLTWNNTTKTVVSQTCTGVTSQLWQSAVHAGVSLFWNDYYDANFHKNCPWPLGVANSWTQSVLTAATQGGDLSMACDNSASGTAWPYGLSQEWAETPPVTPTPTPTPTVSSPSPPPPPPAIDCTTPAAVVPAPGVPSGSVGDLLDNETGTQIAAWDATQTMFDGAHTYGTIGTDAAGDAVLTTTGAKANQAMLSSCPFTGHGTAYTHGIFEARMNLPAAAAGEPGVISGWPAFWLSGMNCRTDTPAFTVTPGQPQCWPAGGEFDIMESGPFSGGYQQADYHWNTGAGTDGTTGSGPDTALQPGWHTFDGVWGPGYVAVYADGTLEWSYTSGNVESDSPLMVIFDMAGTGSGVPSALLVAYLRVWGFR
jgi:hypothetical protein